ncbi:putative ribonuclease H-like domain-containing protein [Tanacetum coccineum]
MNVSPIPTSRILKDILKRRSWRHNSLLIQGRVYKNKKDERGIIVRNKARLVAQGYTQEEGIDYDKVFAPVARIEAIRLFFAYASFMGFIVYQMDGKSEFLYGTINKEVYVCQPLSFEDPQFTDKVYNLEKALYGLHQAPRAWYETLSTYLLENGFRRGTIDKTLFIKKGKGDILLMQVFVDDIIFGSTKKSLCIEFEQMMHKRFHMRSMGELTFFLGLQVKQKDDGIFISQDKYVADILKKFDFVIVKTASTPIETNKALLKDEEAEDVDVHLYRSMIRSLMYLAASRPDITFAVCACARFQVTPKVSHLHAVKRIFRYLKGQLKLSLWYPRDSPFDLEAFSDSDYAGASLDRKSTKRDSYEKKLIQVIKIHTDHNVADLLTKAFDVSSMERAATTASSLEVEQDSDNINRTQSMPSYHIGGAEAQTRYEATSKPSNDPPLSRVNTLGSEEDSMKPKGIDGTSNLKYYDQHNMVALLEKSDGREGFHQIVDFLNASHIREQEIIATVDGHAKTVTIASVRKYLKLADVGGLSSLPNTEIFDQLSLMGYATTSDKITSQKGHFSPQWKETIRQEVEIPQSNFPTQTPVANEAAFTGVNVIHGGAATTVSSIDARQGGGNIPKSPTMPHHSPLPRDHTYGSDEGSLPLHELTVLYIKFSNKVESLETKLKQTKQIYGDAFTKLIKKVKKLKQTIQTSHVGSIFLNETLIYYQLCGI